MRIREFLESASAAVDFVVCNASSGDLVFGINFDEAMPIAYDKYQIENKHSNILDWEVTYWYASDPWRVWIDV